MPSGAHRRAPGGQQRAAPPRARHRRLPVQTLARALRWTALSAFVPGAGHLAAGRRRAGLAMLVGFLALMTGAALAVLAVPRSRLLQIGVEPDSLELVMIAGVALALIWMFVVLSSWLVTRPAHLGTGQRMLATAVVVALSLGVAAPFAAGVRTAFLQRDLIMHIFPDAPPRVSALSAPGAARAAVPAEPATVLAGKPRVNVLLLGGDGGPNREGVRTDTMIMASIDTVTGETVLVSLPRNLEQAQFPAGSPMAGRFPAGFPDLLNAVYPYAESDPAVVPGARHPGGQLIKDAFGVATGVPVDYFVLVNLAGFRDLVDAVGGVTLTVPPGIPIGGRTDASGRTVTEPTGYLEPGRRKLDGYDALWYGRSRFGSDDYQRMDRQRCLLGALARQANPLTVLSNFGALSGVAKRIILSDIPQAALPDLLALAQKAKGAKVTSVTFVRSERFKPEAPDFAFIRAQVADALAGRVEPAAAAGNARPAPSAAPSAAPTPAPLSPTPAAGPATAAPLDAVCDY